MDFFIEQAAAEEVPAGAGPAGGGIAAFAPLIILVVVFYFLLIRPQNKRNKEHKELIGSLQKGDEIVTTGGLLGKVIKVEGDYLVFQVSEKVELKLQKAAVAASLPKGTLKNI